MKTTVFVLSCLVCMLFTGCGDDLPVVHLSAPETEPGYAQPGPLYTVTIPDSVQYAVVWGQNFPLLISAVSKEELVEEGDTILTGTDPFYTMETERLEMALSMAMAMGDNDAADSLRVMLSDSSSYIPIASRHEGLLTLLVYSGGTIQPGDTIAIVESSPPDSMYILSPEYIHIRWPDDVRGFTVTDAGLLCYGAIPGERAPLPGIWSVQQQFIYEDGLQSFVVTTTDDTLPVTVVGFTDTSKIIFCEQPLDSLALNPW